MLLWVLRDHLVRLVIGTGEFDWQSTLITADLIGWLAFGVVAQGLSTLLVRAFYALQDTKTPVAISVGSLILGIGTMLLLRPIAGVAALAIGTSVNWIINMAALLIVLRRRIGAVRERQFVCHMMALLCATVVSAVSSWFILKYMQSVTFADTFFMVLLQAAVLSLIAGALYLFIIRIFGFHDARYLIELVRRRPKEEQEQSSGA